MDGRGGFDTVSYEGETGGVRINLALGTGTDSQGDTETLRNIEALRGSDFDDTLFGNAGFNLLDGGGGADRLVGGAGLDIAGYGGSPTSSAPAR